MAKPHIFLDSSALISGIISETGAAHALLQLGETGDILLTICEFVLVESERAVAKKAPEHLELFRTFIKRANLGIVDDPIETEVNANLNIISDPDDVPILLSAMAAGVDFLVTHNRKHFIDDPQVAERSGIRIGTPGDAIAWIRENLSP